MIIISGDTKATPEIPRVIDSIVHDAAGIKGKIF